MDTKLLKCFITVADELHFGRAAQKLDILPSALGRNIKLLEEGIGVKLFLRTTRNVSLTRSGHALLNDIRPLLIKLDEVLNHTRLEAQADNRVIRIGAIDSAALGLIPCLVKDLREQLPNIELVIEEDKSAKLLPKLWSGALDIAFVRPPDHFKEEMYFEHLMTESAVVALHTSSHLVDKESLTVYDLADVPLIVPSPRKRPHSYNLTNNLFIQAELTPKIIQHAEEKHTIINLVAAEVGVAILPYWNSRVAIDNVTFRPLVDKEHQKIPALSLSAAWLSGSADPVRDMVLDIVRNNIAHTDNF